MKPQKLNSGASTILAQDTEEVKLFELLMRKWEKAYTAYLTTGADPTAELYALATACANSVLKKCLDPQRKTAPEREKTATDWKKAVSNSGVNPALKAVKAGIAVDMGTPDRPGTLDSLQTASARAYKLTYNKQGDLVTEVADPDAARAVDALIADTLTDGMDMVQTASLAIWELSAQHHAKRAGWMEKEYTERKLSAKVLIQAEDSAKWEDITTTAIQEVFRAIRREVQNSRAMQTDPRNGYSYIEETTADPDSTKEETIYRRLQKWADIGGYTHDGQYTTDMQNFMDYNDVVAKLNLTDRQATIIALRMRGYGVRAIATYLGVTKAAIDRQIYRLRDKCESFGFTPAMWLEMADRNIYTD